MTTRTAPLPHCTPAQTRWLVSPAYDGFFFIGSAALALVFLGIYHAARMSGWLQGPQSVLFTYFLFTAFFDHPHIFQTFSRTHADRAEFARHRGWHTWGLTGFVACGVALSAAGFDREIIVFTAVYGSWHVIRQHAGFLKIYKGLNRDTRPLDNVLDGLVFYVGMFAFLLRDRAGLGQTAVLYGEQDAWFPGVPEWLVDVTMTAFWLSAAAFVVRQLWSWRVRRRRPNLPKLLLLGAALSTHYLVFVATATPFLVAEATETIYHDVQYHGWMTHYQRRRFRTRQAVARWAKMALVYGVIVGTIEILGLVHREWSWLFVPFAMVVVYHYFVDGMIWRFGEDSGLRRDLFDEPTTEGGR